MKEKIRTWTKWVYWFSFAVAVIAVYKTLDNISDIFNWIGEFLKVLMPFLSGILIAYLLYIPSRKFESIYNKVKILNKFSRKLAVLTVYVILVLLIVLLINVILPAVSSSVTELMNNFPVYQENIIEFINNLPEDSLINKEKIMEIVDNIKNIDFASYFSPEKIVEYIKGVMTVAQGVFSIFVAIIVSVYLLLQRTDILNFLRKFASAVFKKDTYKMLGNYFTQANDVFFKFVSSQVLDGIVVGIITSIVMLIMNVKYAVLLGFVIGLFNIIPYFGAIIAVGLAVLITWITGGLTQAITLAIVIIILQQIDANIINPKIVGNSLSLSPILIIFAVTVGGAYFNVIGMFLAVPVMAVIKIIICDYIDYKNAKKKDKVLETEKQ